jgi:hypothetical protein
MANPKTQDIQDTQDGNHIEDRGTKPVEHNKTGHRQPTSRNEPRRTPESRSDRESHVGGSNQLQSRRTGGSR